MFRRLAESTLLFAALVVAWCALVSAGCARPPSPALARVVAAVDSADGHRVRALEDLNRVRPSAAGPVRQGVVSAANELNENAQGKNLADAKRALAAATDHDARTDAELSKLKANRYVRAALAIQSFVRLILWGGLIVGILALAFRVWAGAGGGPIVAVVGHVLGGLISGGITIFWSAAAWVGARIGSELRPQPQGA